MADEVIVDGGELIGKIRLTFRLPPMFGLRMWVATQLFRAAGWFSGMDVRVTIEEIDDATSPN